MYVYLDLNVFDRAEKLERLQGSEREQYDRLLELIRNQKIETAYSNAHLNDLFRGYQKNPQYTDGHLQNIKSLTSERCILPVLGKCAGKLALPGYF